MGSVTWNDEKAKSQHMKEMSGGGLKLNGEAASGG